MSLTTFRLSFLVDPDLMLQSFDMLLLLGNGFLSFLKRVSQFFFVGEQLGDELEVVRHDSFHFLLLLPQGLIELTPQDTH